MNNIRVITQKIFTIHDTLSNPNSLYVFGDNLARVGTKGQACIRPAPNSFGIATKKRPSMSSSSFFSNSDIDYVLQDIEKLKKIVNTVKYSVVVFPEDGLGTGLAKLQEYAPDILHMLIEFQNNSVASNTLQN